MANSQNYTTGNVDTVREGDVTVGFGLNDEGRLDVVDFDGNRYPQTGEKSYYVTSFYNSLPKFQGMDEESLWDLYINFSAYSAVYNFIGQQHDNLSETAISDLMNTANEYKSQLKAYLEKYANEHNSYAGQVDAMREAGINPDLNGVDNIAREAPEYNPATEHKLADVDNPLNITDSFLNVIGTGLDIASLVYGVGTGASMSKLAMAGQVADITKTLAEAGYDSSEFLGLSRKQQARVDKGLRDLPESQKKLIQSGKNARIVRNLLDEATGKSELDLIPLVKEIQEIQLEAQKTYEETLNRGIQAALENARNKYDKEVYDNLNPEVPAQMQSLGVTGAIADIANTRSQTAENVANTGLINTEAEVARQENHRENELHSFRKVGLNFDQFVNIQNKAYFKSLEFEERKVMGMMKNEKYGRRYLELQALLSNIRNSKIEALNGRGTYDPMGALNDYHNSMFDNWTKRFFSPSVSSKMKSIKQFDFK